MTQFRWRPQWGLVALIEFVNGTNSQLDMDLNIVVGPQLSFLSLGRRNCVSRPITKPQKPITSKRNEFCVRKRMLIGPSSAFRPHFIAVSEKTYLRVNLGNYSGEPERYGCRKALHGSFDNFWKEKKGWWVLKIEHILRANTFYGVQRVNCSE